MDTCTHPRPGTAEDHGRRAAQGERLQQLMKDATGTDVSRTYSDPTSAIQRDLGSFLSRRRASLAEIDDRCSAIAERLESFVLGGGKRMRPRFGIAAYYACAPSSDSAESADIDTAVKALSALELIQACALIHDDIIDDSATRRGLPTVHVALAAEHNAAAWNGNPDDYGRSQAILLGDIALAWADEMFSEALLECASMSIGLYRAAHRVWADMKTEVLGGQMLDVHAEATNASDLDTPARVNRFKTAAYTIERPVHLGGVLAGAPHETLTSLRRFGVSMGIAYQLVDDMLGVFGDPAVTGKPSGDDIREGKRTLLINYALNEAPPSDAAELARMLGAELDSEQLARSRDILTTSGAVDHVRKEIERLTSEGVSALDGAALDAPGEEALRALAERAVDRAF